jgi:hypothetical protein
MCERLETLQEVTNEVFVKIDSTNYKSESSDAIVLNENEFNKLLDSRIKEEIPFIENDILKYHLPDKFQYEVILDQYKELSKFDHTLLSNFIIDETLFSMAVLNSSDISIEDLILDGSTLIRKNNLLIFVTNKN